MERSRLESLLALGLALISLHLGTGNRCFAAEVSKTVEVGNGTGSMTDPLPVAPQTGRLPRVLLALDTHGGDLAQYALVVDKKTRTLTVWESAADKVRAVAEFAVDLGKREGNKTKAGDLKTPEGIYFLQSSMDGHKLDFDKYGDHVFTTDYPNYFDRLEKKTGTGIWLHAIPDGTSLQRGSHGCVVVRNKDIAALEKYIEVKRTPLIVVDEVGYLDEKEWQSERARWTAWAAKWAESQFEKIEPGAVQIFMQGSQFVLRVGPKILYAVREGETLEVLKELTLPFSEAAIPEEKHGG